MSDLDEEELKATKKLQEKTADELFEEVGYYNSIETNYNIKYFKDEYNEITFDLTDNEVLKIGFYDNYITFQELQAINKKCKELGWLDE